MKLSINLIAGLFFLIGVIISTIKPNNKNLTNFSISTAFIVLLYLLIFDIIPETIELFENFNKIYIIPGILTGLLILIILEKLIPHHNHYEEVQHHENHLSHIGIMTSLALIIHNLVEGMSIYTITSTDIKAGLICVIGVGLHNIPFGIEITTLLNKEKTNKKWIYITLLTISTFIGGLIISIFEQYLSNLIIGLLLSISTGMIIYLILFELLIELKENFNKQSIYGLITGVILMIISSLI